MDDKNRIASGKAIDVKTNKMIYGYQNKYDEKGNHYESGSLNSKGELTEFYRRKFNGKGIATSENIEDLDGNPTFRIRYEYRPQADSSWVEQLTYYNDVLKEIRVRENTTY